MTLIEECMRVYKELHRLNQLPPEDILEHLGGDERQVFDAMCGLEAASVVLRERITPPDWQPVARVLELRAVPLVDLRNVPTTEPDAPSESGEAPPTRSQQ